MPLRDHFRSPVNDKHRWEAVHRGWPMLIVKDLFDLLPKGYQAEPGVHLGSTFEVDIGAMEDDSHYAASLTDFRDGGVATLAAIAPTLTVIADLSEQDAYEVRIYDAERERQLVAAIEIVSPSNKDRPEAREHFVGKVAALLRRDVCISIVDMVSVRPWNLYAEVLARFNRTDPQLAPPPPMYAVTLRARRRPKRPSLLDAWFYPMAVGQPLATLPIWLSAELHVMLALESSYEETCRLLRIA